MSTIIDLPLLRTELARLLREVEKRHGAAAKVHADHYGLVESAAGADLSQEPKLGLGQLSDDASELQAMADRPSEDLIPWHDLKRLVGLLDALAAVDLPTSQ